MYLWRLFKLELSDADKQWLDFIPMKQLANSETLIFFLGSFPSVALSSCSICLICLKLF